MSLDDTSKQKDFESIDNEKDIYRYLSEGAKIFAPILIWPKDQGTTIESRISLFSDVQKTFYAWIPQDFNMNAFLAQIQERNSSEFLFSLSLPNANLFFKAIFFDHDTGGLKFKIPPQIFKFQRRKNPRVTISELHTIRIQYQDPLYEHITQTKKMFDISAYGVAFLIDAKDAPLYPPGLHLKNFSFTLHGVSIKVEAEIRHITSLKKSGEPSLKVSALFKNISDNDFNALASYIFTYLSR